MTTTDPDVLIVGAGPVGTTLDVDLVRRGVGVRIIDKAAGGFDGSRANGIQPRTLEVFDDLGCPDIVASFTARSSAASSATPPAKSTPISHARRQPQRQQPNPTKPPLDKHRSIERFHQTLKRWLTSQPRPASIAELQTLLDTFATLYNTEQHRANTPRPVRGHHRHDTIDHFGKLTCATPADCATSASDAPTPAPRY